jgi:error-prone DNA polymerase
VPVLEALATAGAFRGFGLTRRQSLWAAGAVAVTGPADPLPGTAPGAAAPQLPPMTPVEETIADLWAIGASADGHPVEHVRPALRHIGAVPAAELSGLAHGCEIIVGGLVTHRQRPPTAGGVLFLSLEDETGLINVVCNRPVWELHRRTALDRAGLLIHGRLERNHGAINVVATRISPLRVAVP